MVAFIWLELLFNFCDLWGFSVIFYSKWFYALYTVTVRQNLWKVNSAAECLWVMWYSETDVGNTTPALFPVLSGELASALWCVSVIIYVSQKGNQTFSMLRGAEICSCWSHYTEGGELCATKSILKRSILLHREAVEVKSGFMTGKSSISFMGACNGENNSMPVNIPGVSLLNGHNTDIIEMFKKYIFQ